MGCNTSKETVQPVDNDGGGDDSVKNDDNKQETVEVANAATKIQAAFRGHQVRSTMKKQTTGSDSAGEPAKKTSQQLFQTEFPADDPELCKAATTIQNSFRSHLKSKGEGTGTSSAEEASAATNLKYKNNDDDDEVNLNDPDLNKAATVIQASFRGHQVRKDFHGSDI